jgi:hypothetical protein
MVARPPSYDGVTTDVPTPEEAWPVAPQGDGRLQDPQVLDEIELYGELVIAASASDQPLSRDEIDHVLGLDRARRSE